MPRKKGKIQMVYDNRAALARGEVIPHRTERTILDQMERRAIKETARLNLPVRHPAHYQRLAKDLHMLAEKLTELANNHSLDEINKASRFATWCRLTTKIWHDEIVLFERDRRPEDYPDWQRRQD